MSQQQAWQRNLQSQWQRVHHLATAVEFHCLQGWFGWDNALVGTIPPAKVNSNQTLLPYFTRSALYFHATRRSKQQWMPLPDQYLHMVGHLPKETAVVAAAVVPQAVGVFSTCCGRSRRRRQLCDKLKSL
jgi:hypothetical protein